MCGSVKVLSQSPWPFLVSLCLLMTFIIIAVLQFTFFLAMDTQVSESEGKSEHCKESQEELDQ